MANERSGVIVTDYFGIVKELRNVDPEFLKSMRKDSKIIARPLQQAVRKNIPNKPPLSGMRPRVKPGRVTWGFGKPAKSVLIKTPRNSRSGKYRTIVRIAVMSAATVLADMAGRSGARVGENKRTRSYPYSLSPTGERTHALTPRQGRNFINNLNRGKGVKQNHASRFVWPAAEASLPSVVAEGQKVIDRAIGVINARMKS